MLDQFLLPRFKDTPMAAITPVMVAYWLGDLGKITGPTYRAHAYSLLRTITRTAVSEDVLRASLCKVPSGGRVKRAHTIEPAPLVPVPGRPPRCLVPAGLPNMRFHDLRHAGAGLAAATGATLAELMVRLGHSTPAAAIRYQHAARGRDAEIAARLSEMVNGAS